ncbi:unnamed protein product [Allacma fusca]|uniref:Uncharacterized protein n=1 Tax=Allacma fusca TaxID=39272 RepID=A0A8J2PMY1_9HEXA|nr:unnamed protein product [Allacma fusca]
MDLQGILAAMPLAYILPALCFIRLEPSRFFSREKLPAIATALFGSLVSGTGLIMLIINGQESQCSHGQALPYCTVAPNSFDANVSSATIAGPVLRSVAASLVSQGGGSPVGEILPHPMQYTFPAF